jgi:copper chaperone NosL
MKLESYQKLLGQPLAGRARALLVVAVVAIPFAFFFPLWTMAFESNQYPDPLRLEIHINRLEGQLTADRDDLREINSLNHYIGMRPLLESDFSEFLWLPFAIGFLGLLILRSIALGTVKDLTDLCVLYLYFGGFSLWTFAHRLYQYGHNLEPDAPIKVDPFTPPFLGRVRIANFHVESYPGGASIAVGLVGACLAAAWVLGALYARRRLRAGAA